MPSPRDLGVDVVRGIALLSMYVAHVAPLDGPGGVLLLTEFLTFPLFALLVGAGAELGHRAAARSGVGAGATAIGTAVRGGVLVLAGLLLEQADSQVAIVLTPLGLLTWLCWVLCRLPAVALAALGVAAAAAAPWTIEVGDRARLSPAGSSWPADLLANSFYPLATLVAAAALGILLTRWTLPEEGVAPRGVLVSAVGGVLLGVCAVLGLARVQGGLDFTPYETEPLEQLFVLMLAAAVFLLGLGLVRWSRSLANAARPLAWMGGMSLTLYILQILWLAYDVHGLGSVTDDSWRNLAILVAGSLALAAGWRALSLPGVWARGPAEGVVGLLVRAATRLSRRTAAVGSGSAGR